MFGSSDRHSPAGRIDRISNKIPEIQDIFHGVDSVLEYGRWDVGTPDEYFPFYDSVEEGLNAHTRCRGSEDE